MLVTPLSSEVGRIACESSLSDWFGCLQRVLEIKQDRVDTDIPILGSDGRVTGQLQPLTARHLDNATLLETFVRWRNSNLSGYLDQRPVSMESTREWLRDVVTNPTRMGFLMFFGSQLIGRNGLVRLNPDGHETDGLVRGERGGGMGFFFAAQVAGLGFAFRVLKSYTVTARVLSDNVLALDNCRRLGFDLTPLAEADLFVRHTDAGVVIEDQGCAADRMEGVRLLTLQLNASSFFAKMLETPRLLPSADHQYIRSSLSREVNDEQLAR